MTQKHKHAEAIIAWANGATIEFRQVDEDIWELASSPTWDNEYQYRVAPERITQQQARKAAFELFNLANSEYPVTAAGLLKFLERFFEENS